MESVLGVLPESLRGPVSAAVAGDTEEIRVRANRRVMIIGREVRRLDAAATVEDCRRMLELACGHSVFACGDELKGCYVTLGDGSRVGLCGKMCPEGMTMPYSFNIRIARQIPGAADGMMGHIFGARLCSALLISPPGAGKTTVLRDCARQLSGRGVKVCIADERGELSAPAHGAPTLDVGDSDVMWGCKKAEAMRLMVRGMSPQALVTDEIASGGDAAAVLDAAGCGVKVLASAHGGGAGDMLKRSGIMGAVRRGAFEKVLLLEKKGGVREIRDITGELA